MLLQGDCLELLAGLPDNSVDAIVTDPPYGLEFMGKEWDKFSAKAKAETPDKATGQTKTWCSKESSGIGVGGPRFSTQTASDMRAFQQFCEQWAAECLRVLKPGGHLLAFGGSRTYHRLACAIEDAGFEIRDQIMWIYGSGFPKSLDVSKAIDKKPEALSTIRFKKWLGEQINACSKTRKQIDDECGFTACSYAKTDGKDYWSTNHPTIEKWAIMKRVIGFSDEWDWIIPNNVAERGFIEATGGLAGGTGNTVGKFSGKQLSDKAISPEAQRWQGWGTALKPAHEPIVVARKPLEGTVAANVLKYGTGAINIDASRVGTDDEPRVGNNEPSNANQTAFGTVWQKSGTTPPEGRWPANVIHDGSDEVVERFPESKGVVRKPTGKLILNPETGWNNNSMVDTTVRGFADEGSAARFFYCAKASKSERNAGLDALEAQSFVQFQTGNGASGKPSSLSEGRNTEHKNFHPTVKPIALMRYLVKMVTPPGGVVLDPFLGSGTTACAAILEGFDWLGCEMTADYWPIIEARTAWAEKEYAKQVEAITPDAPTLF